MENAVEAVQQPQTPPPASPAAPAAPSDETSAQPKQQVGTEGTEKQGEAEETPQRRESRRQRQLNRERERRIAAETELRLFREQQQGKAAERQRPDQVSDDEPKRDQFGSFEEFVEARAEWKAEKKAAEIVRKTLDESKKSDEQQRTKGEQERTTREWNAKLEKARDAVEDFDEVCAESEAAVTPAMSSAILESDHGALIAYHLAKNPAEAERISKLSPSKQAAAIVALEDRVKAPAKQPSNAPAPINPVGKKGSEVQKDPGQMTETEYAAYRKKRRAAKGLT